MSIAVGLFIFVAVSSTVLFQVAQFRKRGTTKKDVLVYTGFMVMGTALWVILSYRLPFPNPTKLLVTLFKPATDVFFGKS